MSKKTKQILAIVALVFMGVFSVTFVIWLAAPKLAGGSLGYAALASIASALALLAVIKLNKTPEEKAELEKQRGYLPDGADRTAGGASEDGQSGEEKPSEMPAERTDEDADAAAKQSNERGSP